MKELGDILQKDALFDILSLADELHRSKSTDPKKVRSKEKSISRKNQVSDLIDLGKALPMYLASRNIL